MYYSQFGEDRHLELLVGGKARGTCVEVGANDGKWGSNSLFFEKLGWDAVLVEANPALCAILRRERSGKVFECAASKEEGTAILHVGEGPEWAHQLSSLADNAQDAPASGNAFTTRPVEVRTRRLDAILEEAGATEIDFISIDVEGHELGVLEGFTPERWRPTIIIVEDNSILGNNDVVAYLRRHGYVRFHRTGVNDWYAQESNRALVGRGRPLGYAWARIRAAAAMVVRHVKVMLYRVPGVARLHRRVAGRA